MGENDERGLERKKIEDNPQQLREQFQIARAAFLSFLDENNIKSSQRGSDRNSYKLSNWGGNEGLLVDRVDLT